MSKSSRAAAVGTNRRYSQPLVSSKISTSSSLPPGGGRRGSEMIASGGGGGGAGAPFPSPASSSSLSSSSAAPMDDKMGVVEAKGAPVASRKPRGKEGDTPSFDADHYNPDGSLRKQFCLPDFDESYDQANNARYIRRPLGALPEHEKEVSIAEIFKK